MQSLLTNSGIIYLPPLTAILNFCVKCENAFVSETEQARVISMKFLVRGISAESTEGLFHKICFLFCSHHEILRKTQNAFMLQTLKKLGTHILLQASCLISHCHEICRKEIWLGKLL